jgi:hypothetical protein
MKKCKPLISKGHALKFLLHGMEMGSGKIFSLPFNSIPLFKMNCTGTYDREGRIRFKASHQTDLLFPVFKISSNGMHYQH